VRHAGEPGAVHVKLVLRDAHWEQRRDMLVGDAVAIAVPAHEAVDRAQPVHDARGVEGMLGQGPQRRALLHAVPVIQPPALRGLLRQL